jgi:hypothetical protein
MHAKPRVHYNTERGWFKKYVWKERSSPGAVFNLKAFCLMARKIYVAERLDVPRAPGIMGHLWGFPTSPRSRCIYCADLVFVPPLGSVGEGWRVTLLVPLVVFHSPLIEIRCSAQDIQLGRKKPNRPLKPDHKRSLFFCTNPFIAYSLSLYSSPLL